MTEDNSNTTRPALADIAARMASARFSTEKAIGAAALVTDLRWQQLLLVLLAVRSFYPGRSGTRLPLYLVVDRRTDIAALRLFLLRYFNATGISDHVQGQKLRAPRTECSISDLLPANQGTFFWLRECAYRRSMPAAMRATEEVSSDECHAGDSVFIIPRDFAAAASAWGIVIDIGG